METDVILVNKHAVLNFVEKHVRLKWKKRKSMLSKLSLLNMPEYAWICLNKQNSEYALSSK